MHRFARRVYFDLWGLPPTPTQLEAFLRDRDPDKRARLIDALLADSRLYAENWISWWDDLLRNDPGSNYAGERKSITDWLLGALENNLPYDRMIAALVNPVEGADPDGFLIGVNWRGDINASQTPYMQAAQNTAQIFLGINLKCASCHDSFINRYKLRESYGMAALFAPQSRLELVRCDVKTGTVHRAATALSRVGHGARRCAAGRPPRRRRAILHRSAQWPRGAHHRQSLLAKAVRPWVGGTRGRNGWRAMERGSTRLAGIRFHGAWQRSEISAAAAHDLADVSTAGGRERGAARETVRVPRAASAAALRRGIRRYGIGRDRRMGIVRERPREGQGGDSCARLAFKASPLGLALGRPIRDQVFTTRDDRPTTFQALELVNGATLENTLRQGALRLLGELPSAPENLFDSGRMTKGAVSFDVDISGLKQLWLLEQDAGSYDPARTVAGWVRVEFFGPQGVRELADLVPAGFRQAGADRTKRACRRGLTMPPGSRIEIPIEGAGYVRIRGRVALDDRSTTDDIEGAVRFSFSARSPISERLVRVSGRPRRRTPALFKSVA